MAVAKRMPQTGEIPGYLKNYALGTRYQAAKLYH